VEEVESDTCRGRVEEGAVAQVLNPQCFCCGPLPLLTPFQQPLRQLWESN